MLPGTRRLDSEIASNFSPLDLFGSGYAGLGSGFEGRRQPQREGQEVTGGRQTTEIDRLSHLAIFDPLSGRRESELRSD
jgi:hypothetical protein